MSPELTSALCSCWAAVSFPPDLLPAGTLHLPFPTLRLTKLLISVTAGSVHTCHGNMLHSVPVSAQEVSATAASGNQEHPEI